MKKNILLLFFFVNNVCVDHKNFFTNINENKFFYCLTGIVLSITGLTFLLYKSKKNDNNSKDHTINELKRKNNEMKIKNQKIEEDISGTDDEDVEEILEKNDWLRPKSKNDDIANKKSILCSLI